MFLKLTRSDGMPVRVNMSIVREYWQHVEKDKDGEGNTFLEYEQPDKNGDSVGIHVKETVEQIDAWVKAVPNIDTLSREGWR